jgi:hypothetical protein
MFDTHTQQLEAEKLEAAKKLEAAEKLEAHHTHTYFFYPGPAPHR